MIQRDRGDQQVTSPDGTRLVVRRMGTGDSVILVHGSGGGLHSWATVATRLADEYELWLPARRGHGPSDVPSGPNSFSAEVAGDRKPDPVEARRAGIGWLHDLEALAADSTDIDRWSMITTPTLLMQGADTWEPMPSTMNALTTAIPHARQVIWPGQSHFATMTAPALVADTLREFFTEVSKQPRAIERHGASSTSGTSSPSRCGR